MFGLPYPLPGIPYYSLTNLHSHAFQGGPQWLAPMYAFNKVKWCLQHSVWILILLISWGHLLVYNALKPHFFWLNCSLLKLKYRPEVVHLGRVTAQIFVKCQKDNGWNLSWSSQLTSCEMGKTFQIGHLTWLDFKWSVLSLQMWHLRCVDFMWNGTGLPDVVLENAVSCHGGDAGKAVAHAHQGESWDVCASRMDLWLVWRKGEARGGLVQIAEIS